MGFQKHTYETRDGGKNWHEVKSRPSVPSAPSKPSGICGRADVESVSFWSAENGYALCGVFGYTTGVYPQYENSLWQTSDAGASWHRCEKCRLGGLATTFTPEEEGASPSLQIQFFDRDHGLISPGLGASDYVTSETDQRVGIFATSDGGASWRPVGLCDPRRRRQLAEDLAGSRATERRHLVFQPTSGDRSRLTLGCRSLRRGFPGGSSQCGRRSPLASLGDDPNQGRCLQTRSSLCAKRAGCEQRAQSRHRVTARSLSQRRQRTELAKAVDAETGLSAR